MLAQAFRFCSLTLLVAVGFAACSWAADEPAEITPDKARDHVGKKVVVVMEVKKAKYSEKRDTVFLDSEADFKDAKNLDVVIESAALKKFKEAGISQPQEHFRDKKIKVTGTIELREDRPYLPVLETKDIEIK